MKLNKLKLTNPYLMALEECHARVESTPLKYIFLIHANEDVARTLDINHTDQSGRYSFGNQSNIGKWNLQALMHALVPMVSIESLKKVLDGYAKLYMDRYLYLKGKKVRPGWSKRE